MKINEVIGAALLKLDPANDEHWTAEGLPSLEAVQVEALDEGITREQLNEHALGFNREVAKEMKVTREGEEAAKLKSLDSAKDISKVQSSLPAPSEKKPTPEPTEAELDLAERRRVLQGRVEEAQANLTDLDADLAKARVQRDALVVALDEAHKAFKAEFPPVKAADAVKDWLRQQSAARIAAGGSMSMVDRVAQRSVGYGKRRIQVPLVGAPAA